MDEFITCLLKNADCIAFIENQNHITFDRFVADIIKTEQEIQSQINPTQTVFEWNFATTYKNIVILFAIAKCKGIIVPVSISDRLFSKHGKKAITCFGSEIFIYENINNVFTQELNHRNSSGIIISTSGTGNAPKDMVIDFDSLGRKYLKLKTRFISTLIFSLEHISGIETLLSIITPGGTMVLEEQRTPARFALSIKKYDVNLIACTPSFLIQLYLKGFWNAVYLKSLETVNVGGELLPVIWLTRLETVLPQINFRQAYGTTESTNIRTTTSPTDTTKFNLGEINKDFAIRNSLLYLRNKQYSLGNWNDKHLTLEEWIETTDIVEVDQNGYLRILGRSEKLISVGGKKVNPVEIEKIIGQLPYITYVKVYGEPNIILGEIVVANVLCNENKPNDIKTLIIKACALHLEAYQIPVKIRLLDEVPLTLRFKNSTS